jgi:cell wall-associated NlpC family hydrolase
VSGRMLIGAVAAIVAPLLALTLGVSALLGGATAAACTLPAAAMPSNPHEPAVKGFDDDQVANATAIIRTASVLGVPLRGQIIAVAVAIRESGLRTLDHRDAAGPDSRGLFQQRAAWGPYPERMNPETSARLFYTGGHGGQPGLLDIPGWQNMPLTLAAHTVQRNTEPNAYADQELDAAALVTTIGSEFPRAIAEDLEQPVSSVDCPNDDGDGLSTDPDAVLPAGFTLPAGTPASVGTAIEWALAQVGTPYHYGGDCTAAHSGVAAHECDCSSLVQMAYRAGHVRLPRTTSEQVRIGTPIYDLAQLRPGDLMFIAGSHGTSTSPRHVGMYIGDGLIVQAPRTGENVMISRASTWTAIAAVRRPVT